MNAKRVAAALVAGACLWSSGVGCGPARPRWHQDPDGIAVSPDGSTLVFVGNGRGGADLYRLDLSTRAVIRLTDTDVAEMHPGFSHSGRLLTYSAGADWPLTPRSIYVRSLDGTLVRRLTNAGDDRLDTCPSFSLDDERIVFAGGFAPRYNNQDLFVMNADGAALKRLTHEHFNCKQHPRFYDLDRSILFESYKNPKDALTGTYPAMVVSQLDLATGKWRERIHEGERNYGVTVASDGRTLAFSSDAERRFRFDIYAASDVAARPQGLNATPRGHGASGLCLAPAPGGTTPEYVYFVANDLELWRARLNGSGAERLADRSLFDDPLNAAP